MIKFAKTKEYKGGFKRGEHETKPRFGLIPYKPLEKVAIHYTLGGIKYGFNNWRKAQDEDIEGMKESALRHILAWYNGCNDEDHFSATIWNMFNYEELNEKKKNDN